MTTKTYYDRLLSPGLLPVLPVGRLRLLSAAVLQGTCHRTTPDPYVAQWSQWFARAAASFHQNTGSNERDSHRAQQELGMMVARRQNLHWSFVVRGLFSARFKEEARKRPHLIGKPIDLFAVFTLFVVRSVDRDKLPENPVSFLNGFGRESVTSCILASDDWDSEARTVVNRILDAIDEIVESEPS